MSVYTIITILLILTTLALSYLVYTLNKRVSLLLKGKNAQTLEGSIHAILDELERVHQNLKRFEQTFDNHNNRIKNSIQSVPTLRFNPFYDSGGNQSFAAAFITEKGDGVVLSSLYSREKTSVFAKPVYEFESEFELTQEEKTVLMKAQKQTNNQ